jgi:hypothetical protein
VGVDQDDDLLAVGDRESTSMSEPAHDEELLVDRNDTALLTFPMNLLILQNRQKKHNSWNGMELGKLKC